MTAGLPNELIELLEKIILDSSAFSDHRKAVKATRTREFDVNTSAIKCLSNKLIFWNGLINLLSFAMSHPFGRKLAKAQLEKDLVKEAIDLSINVDDLGAYTDVVSVASQGRKDQHSLSLRQDILPFLITNLRQ
uniref:Uncharacterized protein n=1 Tax=Glossina morsitans morsitans TaxID=37546 RepID=A0A1B0FKA8_GLOMM